MISYRIDSEEQFYSIFYYNKKNEKKKIFFINGKIS